MRFSGGPLTHAINCQYLPHIFSTPLKNMKVHPAHKHTLLMILLNTARDTSHFHMIENGVER